MVGFNTQPPEGGWGNLRRDVAVILVSTHSRPKAAGMIVALDKHRPFVSTHSRPKAAGWGGFLRQPLPHGVSTHSRPKAAGCFLSCRLPLLILFQHTAARRRLEPPNAALIPKNSFNTQPPEGGWCFGLGICTRRQSFNTQPPEGGWSLS